MCPCVEKKDKSVVFSLTYKYYETAYTIFSTPCNLLYYSNPLLLIIMTVLTPLPPPPTIISYYSLLLSLYYSRLESR